MAEHVTKEQITDWFSPYGHLDKPIPFETLVSDLRGMKAADVAPVRHGRWIGRKSCHTQTGFIDRCSVCQKDLVHLGYKTNFCPNCGAKMDGGTN